MSGMEYCGESRKSCQNSIQGSIGPQVLRTDFFAEITPSEKIPLCRKNSTGIENFLFPLKNGLVDG
jgi:hypothetical protein